MASKVTTNSQGTTVVMDSCDEVCNLSYVSPCGYHSMRVGVVLLHHKGLCPMLLHTTLFLHITSSITRYTHQKPVRFPNLATYYMYTFKRLSPTLSSSKKYHNTSQMLAQWKPPRAPKYLYEGAYGVYIK